MRSRIVVGTLFGAAAGFIGFLLQEALVPHDAVLSPPIGEMLKLGLLVGLMLGVGIGAIEGAVLGSAPVLLRGCLTGAAIGAVGGVMGIYLGGAVYSAALFGKDPYNLAQSGQLLDFAHSVLARALGWTLLGALPGLAVGAGTLSQRRALHGLIGGMLGGFIGGFSFDLVATLFASPLQGAMSAASGGPQIIEIGGPSRAVGFTAIGALTGFFIGLVEELLKQAWVRVLVGRNEGKDYIISKPMTILGRDERADVPIFTDPALAPQHAAIRRDGNRHTLLDGGSPIGVVLNGQRISEAQLKDGDLIQLGQVSILFREKATAARVAPPNRDRARSRPVGAGIPTSGRICEFCGTPKDASGHCSCTIPPAGPIEAGGHAEAESAGSGWRPAAAHHPLSQGLRQTQPPGQTSGRMDTVVSIGAQRRLSAIDGPCAGQTFGLIEPIVSIGRESGRQIRLEGDSGVSRRHARVELRGATHVIVDEGSANGTYVNGVRITEQTLEQGDIIQIGSGSYRYE